MFKYNRSPVAVQGSLNELLALTSLKGEFLHLPQQVRVSDVSSALVAA
jgi:hypothetical protein